MGLVLWVKAQGLAEEWDRVAVEVVWMAPSPVQAPVETASVQAVAPRFLTAEECPATMRLVPNVGLKWSENREEEL